MPVHLVDHPLVHDALASLRDKRTAPEGFRRAANGFGDARPCTAGGSRACYPAGGDDRAPDHQVHAARRNRYT